MNIEEKLSRGFELLQEKDIDHSLDIAREVQKEAPDTPEGYYLEALIICIRLENSVKLRF